MEKKIIVRAGFHQRDNCPVCLGIGRETKTGKLVDNLSGKEIPCQFDKDRIWWVADGIEKGGEKEYIFSDKAGSGFPCVELEKKDGEADVKIDKKLFATYHFGASVVRPFLNPVIGPSGESVLRELVARENPPDHDHRHQRGMLVAHGDVNGVDDWSEEEGHGSVRHDAFKDTVSGPVFAKIVSENSWLAKDGKKVLSETRNTVFYNTTEARIIDFEITFRATEGKVVFGDTKEGGIMSVRAATSIRGDRQGRIETSSGGIGEKESWGKRAHWCDFSGKLGSGIEGITIFDNPANFRYPTYWHVRDYGLMTANPFALSYYYDDKNRNGSHTVEAGQDFVFRYRIFIHSGDAGEARVPGAFNNYVNPPEVSII